MKIGKKIIVLAVIIFVILPVFAHAVSWLPLVPCGVANDNPDTPQDETKPCNRCDLFRLLKNIIDFVLIGLMPPAAAILFVWGGFLILMGGANPGWITQGKSIFWNTAIGVAIISSSWLITNTIIRSIAADNVAPEWWKFECRVATAVSPLPSPTGTQPPDITTQPPTTTQPPAPQIDPLMITTSSLSDARQDFNYSQTIQATGGKTPYNWFVSGGSQLPSGLMINGSTGEIFGKPTTSGNFSFAIGIQDSSSPVKQATKQLSIKVVAPAASVVISNVVSKNITNTSAVITWTTDKPSSSQVAYGKTTVYGPPTSLNNTQVTNHSVTVTGLTPGTTYNYQAISSITGFTARSSNNIFKTTGQSPTPQPPGPQPEPPIGTLACMFNGVNYTSLNLCSGQKRPGGCGNSSCSQYLPSIQKYAKGAATVAVLKTFMVIESDCDIKAVTGTSYGLMQISPATGNKQAYKCGIDIKNTPITQSWLTNPANADKSICLGAAIINSIATGTCGSQPRNIYAGYNAGPGYCTTSRDCSGEQSCGGGVKKGWECPYDNSQHTVCNTGLYETKQGATYINYCLNNLSF